jgi:hypothetical protein
MINIQKVSIGLPDFKMIESKEDRKSNLIKLLFCMNSNMEILRNAADATVPDKNIAEPKCPYQIAKWKLATISKCRANKYISYLIVSGK